jgi:hypothetical protein
MTGRRRIGKHANMRMEPGGACWRSGGVTDESRFVLHISQASTAAP